MKQEDFDVQTMPLKQLLDLTTQWAASPAPVPMISGKLAIVRLIRELGEERKRADENEHQLATKIEQLRDERTRTDALITSLPRCEYHSDRTATGGESEVCGLSLCDECSKGRGHDYPRAEPLRAIAKART